MRKLLCSFLLVTGVSCAPGGRPAADGASNHISTGAPDRPFTAYLSGDEETPPVTSTGTGTATLLLTVDQTKLLIAVNAFNFETAITASHIHRGPRGTSGPIVFDLGSDYSSPNVKIWNIPPDLVDALINEELYVNINTTAYPDGEIRGQVQARGAPVDRASGQNLFGLVNPRNLSQHHVAVLATQTPNSPDISQSDALVGPCTDGLFQLTYTGTDGQTHVVTQSNVRIDNLTHQFFVGGQPASTLHDVFPSLPIQPADDAALVTMHLTYPATLSIGALANGAGGAAVVAATTTYITDRPNDPANPDQNVVEVFDDGAPGLPNVTAQQEADFFTAQGLTMGDQVGERQVVKTGDPANSYDCHGYVFTGNKWINNDQVEKIRMENGYTERGAGMVQVGDLVIYRDDMGVTHTGIVRAICANGQASVIESKWGRLGRYLHQPGDVPSSYGTPRYYSSPRANGHQLRTR